MKVVSRLKSIDTDINNDLYISIKLDFVDERDLQLAQNNVKNLIFSNLKDEFQFPIYKIVKDELIFRIDSVGIQKLHENGINWYLIVRFEFDKNNLNLNVKNSVNKHYINTIYLKNQNKESIKFNVYFCEDRDISLITIYKTAQEKIIEKVNSIKCEDNKLIISGLYNDNSLIDRNNLFLYAIPCTYFNKESLKKFKINTYQQYFEGIIPLTLLSSSVSEYHLLFGIVQNEEIIIKEITKDFLPNNDLLTFLPEKYDKKEGTFFIKHDRFLLEDKVLPLIHNINIQDNHINIYGRLVFNDKFVNKNIILKEGFVKHQLTGYINIFENIELSPEGSFKIVGDINKNEYFNFNGDYDLLLTLECEGIVSILRAKFDIESHIPSNIVLSFNRFIFTNNSIKVIRPLVSNDSYIIFSVNDFESNHVVKRIMSHNNTIQIKSGVLFHDINYKILKIELISNIDSNVIFPLNTFEHDGKELIITINEDYLNKHFSYELNLDLKIKVTYQLGDKIYSEFLLSENNGDHFAKTYPVYKIGEKNINVYPYYIQNKQFVLKVGKNLDLYITKIYMEKNNLIIKLKSLEETFIDGDVIFISSDNKKIKVPVSVQRNIKKDQKEFDIKLNLINNNETILTDNIYTVYFVIQNKNGEKYNCPLLIFDETVLSQNNGIQYNSKKLNLKLTNKNKNLVIETYKETQAKTERISLFKLKVKDKIAKYVAKIMAPLKNKKVWLIGENLGQIARDNGLAFFKYCNENNIPEDYYYVSKSNNFDREKLFPYRRRVITYDSFKHFYLYHLSKLLIVSHGIRDVIPSPYHSKMRVNPKSIIYLQHGIIAMKKLFFNSKSYNGKIKKFVVSSTQEKEILINHMNFKRNQVMVTGLARFDSLKHIEIGKNEILWMPTWREWLIESNNDFQESKFFQFYSSLLNNPKLNTVLKDHNINIKFVLHVEMLKFASKFKSLNDQIEILSPDQVDIQELIKTSRMLITDYSSIAFDFAYQNKPIMFYQFDLDDYLIHRGSYIDMNKDLPGYLVQSEDEFISKLINIIKNRFMIEKEVGLRKNKFFDYLDSNNCERIYKEIKNLGD